MNRQEIIQANKDFTQAELITSMKKENLIKITCKADLKKIPMTDGHYAILSNKPVTADLQDLQGPDKDYSVMNEGLYIWYNGTKTGSLRSRLTTHLFNDKANTGAITTGYISTDDLLEQINSTKSKQGVNAWDKAELVSRGHYSQQGEDVWKRKGVTIGSEYFEGYEFYVAIVEDDYFQETMEQEFRAVFGVPGCVINENR